MKHIDVHSLFRAKYAVDKRSCGALANQVLNSTPLVLKDLRAIGTLLVDAVPHAQFVAESVLSLSLLLATAKAKVRRTITAPKLL
jgi:hypothetical protein